MNRQDKRAGLQETHDRSHHAMTKYDPKMALSVIERVAAGELLRDVTAKTSTPEMVSTRTFLMWVNTVPELGEAYRLAMEMSAHALEEEAIEEARNRRDAPGTAPKVSASNNLIRQLQWSAERRDPGRYGQKNNAALIVPVVINTTLNLPDTKRQVSESPEFYKLSVPIEDGEFSEVQKPEAEKEVEGLTVLNPADFQTPDAKADFSKMLRVDEPVISTNRQPLLHRERKQMSRTKRQLVPRVKVPGQITGMMEAERNAKEYRDGISKLSHEADGVGRQSDSVSVRKE